jgi:drug/metabolite transporter (DMT)-like permease
MLLGEPLTLRLLLASAAILGGIALVLLLGASRANATDERRD